MEGRGKGTTKGTKDGRWFVRVLSLLHGSAVLVEALVGVVVGLLAVDEAHGISQWGHDFARSRSPAGNGASLDPLPTAEYNGYRPSTPASTVIVTGIVAALRGLAVRNDLAMSGEITIKGKVLPIGGVQQKVRAACDAGGKEALLPADNLHEAETLPEHVLRAVKLTPVQSVAEVLKHALVEDGGV